MALRPLSYGPGEIPDFLLLVPMGTIGRHQGEEQDTGRSRDTLLCFRALLGHKPRGEEINFRNKTVVRI